ncbi:MAG TPA: O-antigen ligase family protein [Candidatus Limnocylindrales bacterium]|nr:O-antigen ligase family protein [Candidatus Limnocylindrales bacterium]
MPDQQGVASRADGGRGSSVVSGGASGGWRRGAVGLLQIGLPLALATIVGAAMLDNLFVRPELRLVRMVVMLVGVAMGASAPAAGLAAVVVLAGAGDILATDLLRRGDLALAEHLLIPLCGVALVRHFTHVRRESLSMLTATSAIYAAVVLASSISVAADAFWRAHLAAPDLGWTPLLENHVLTPLAAAPTASLVFHPDATVMWAMRSMILVAGAFLLIRTAELSSVALQSSRVAAATTLALGITCAIGLLQWFFPFNLDTIYFRKVQPGLFRIDSTWPDPNSLACYLLVAAPIAVAWTAWPSGGARPRPVLAVAWAAVSCVILWLTGSRGSLFALVLAATALALAAAALAPRWHLMRKGRTRRNVAVAAVSAALLPFALAAAITATGAADDLQYGRSTSRLQVLALSLDLRRSPREILTGRVRLWEAALALWRESPLRGVGAGQYAGRKRAFLAQHTPNPDAWRGAHNAYLELLAETGILGLAAILAVAAGMFASLDTILRRGDHGARMRALAMTWALLAVGFSQLAQDWVHRRGGILVLASLVVLVALERRSVEQPPEAEQRSR